MAESVAHDPTNAHGISMVCFFLASIIKLRLCFHMIVVSLHVISHSVLDRRAAGISSCCAMVSFFLFPLSC